MPDVEDEHAEELASRPLVAYLFTIILTLLVAGISPHAKPAQTYSGILSHKAIEFAAEGEVEASENLLPGGQMPATFNLVVEPLVSNSLAVPRVDVADADSPLPEQRLNEQTSAQQTASPQDGLRFDLADFSGAITSAPSKQTDQFQVTKPLLTKGETLGAITITIDKFAQNYATPDELRSVLGQSAISKNLEPLEEGTLVSFQRLREYGIDLRYDPVADHIILEP